MTSPYPPNANCLAVRWTIGNVHSRGFEMLRLSLACAFRLFGPDAKYLVCVNSLSIEDGRGRTGSLPFEPEWRESTRDEIPEVLRSYFDQGLMEGMGWKLAPLRTSPERFELALDNDCILWALQNAIRQ